MSLEDILAGCWWSVYVKRLLVSVVIVRRCQSVVIGCVLISFVHGECCVGFGLEEFNGLCSIGDADGGDGVQLTVGPQTFYDKSIYRILLFIDAWKIAINHSHP